MKKEGSPDDEDTFENPYPLEGKYKNEEDRQRLLSMTEIEREDVLYQRSEEVQRLKEKRDLAALVRSQIKDQPRRSGREGQLRSEKAGKRDELSELKKRREEKSNAAKVRVLLSLLMLSLF
jgi:RNA polymerase-associated protein RTF1